MHDDRLFPAPPFAPSVVPKIVMTLTPDGQLIQSVAIKIMSKLATQDGTASKENLERYAVYAFEVAEVLLAESHRLYGDTLGDFIKS